MNNFIFLRLHIQNTSLAKIINIYLQTMIGSKLAEARQSYDVKNSLKATTDINKDEQIISRRDSQTLGYDNYGLDVELQDNKKKMLEEFKKSSGIRDSQKENSQLNQIKYPKLHTDTFTSLTNNQIKTINEDEYKRDKNTEKSLKSTFSFSNLQTSRSQQEIQSFIREVFLTLGLSNEDDSKLRVEYLLNSAYSRYLDMKCTGRWKLIEDYFKGQTNLEDNEENQTKSIIKKKSKIMLSQGLIEKKKVRVVQPQTASELEKIKVGMQNNLEQWIQKMTKGCRMKRYNEQLSKIEAGIIYFSYDFKFFIWESQKPITQQMKKFSGITQGIKCKSWSSYKQKNSINENQTFSLIFPQISYNFIADSEAQRDQFIIIVRQIKSYC